MLKALTFRNPTSVCAAMQASSSARSEECCWRPKFGGVFRLRPDVRKLYAVRQKGRSMMMYRFIRSSTNETFPASWLTYRTTMTFMNNVRFARYGPEIWSAKEVGSSPVSGEIINLPQPNLMFDLVVEHREIVDSLHDIWRVRGKLYDEIELRWVFVRYAGRGVRVNNVTFHIPNRL